MPSAPASTRPAAIKWAAIRLVLQLGCSVLYSDLDVAFLRDPLPLLTKDVDLEAMSDAWDEQLAYGGCFPFEWVRLESMMWKQTDCTL